MTPIVPTFGRLVTDKTELKSMRHDLQASWQAFWNQYPLTEEQQQYRDSITFSPAQAPVPLVSHYRTYWLFNGLIRMFQMGRDTADRAQNHLNALRINPQQPVITVEAVRHFSPQKAQQAVHHYNQAYAQIVQEKPQDGLIRSILNQAWTTIGACLNQHKTPPMNLQQTGVYAVPSLANPNTHYLLTINHFAPIPNDDDGGSGGKNPPPQSPPPSGPKEKWTNPYFAISDWKPLTPEHLPPVVEETPVIVKQPVG